MKYLLMVSAAMGLGMCVGGAASAPAMLSGPPGRDVKQIQVKISSFLLSHLKKKFDCKYSNIRN